MSSNINSRDNMPPPATKAGGMRLPAPYRAPKDNEESAPQNDKVLTEAEQNQLDLSEALGIPLHNETPAVRDPSEHPKANASTYVSPQSTVWNNAGKQRSNAKNGVNEIQQIGGAYGAYRN